jgi:hypothetical protein
MDFAFTKDRSSGSDLLLPPSLLFQALRPENGLPDESLDLLGIDLVDGSSSEFLAYGFDYGFREDRVGEGVRSGRPLGLPQLPRCGNIACLA